MRNLIPNFIHEQFRTGIHHGQFQAAALFFDITGFTPLTETLMHRGQEGAEILSGILNRVLTPAIDLIVARGGCITAFAGDAITAVFAAEAAPSQAAAHAVATAWAIQEQFRKHAVYHTRFGSFSLAVHTGIGYGTVEWGIVGHEEKTFFFRGPAIYEAVRTGQQAPAGQIWVGSSCHSLCAPHAALQETAAAHRILRVHHLPAPSRPAPPPPPDPAIMERFLPDNILALEQAGEFRNVTAIVLSFPPHLPLSQLNSLVQTLIGLSGNFGGYLNKIIFSDHAMTALCLFGAPQGLERNVHRALSFVLALRRQLPPDSWRGGLTYGTVFAGLLGNEKRGEYTVLGDSVNLAFRLAEQAEWGEILLEENAYLQAQARYALTALGKRQVKGKRAPVAVYHLAGEKASAAPLFGSLFIGQETALAAADQRLQKTAQGKFGGLLYVYGNAGAGKSHLLYELQRRHPHVQYLYAPCDAIQQHSLRPFYQLFQRYFAQTPDASPEQNRASFSLLYRQLQTQTRRQNAALADEMERLQPFMAGFLGLPTDGTLYDQLPPDLRYQNILQALQTVLLALVSQAPLVLIVEDIHWLDEDSAQLLRDLYPRMEAHPFLLIATARYQQDGKGPRLPLETEAAVIHLDALSAGEVQALGRSLLGGPLSQALLDHLQEKTDGNPFFVIQTLRYYRDEGIIAPQQAPPHTWDLQQSQTPIPATIADLLVARIDQLSASLREAVQTASVLGYEFPVQVLSEMLRRQGRRTPIEAPLHHGMRQNIWQPLSELNYIFSHAYLRDTAYNMQLREHLRQLHRLAADSMVQLYPEDTHLYPQIAFHYEQAEMPQQAARYFQLAGDAAYAQYALNDAITYYRHALQHLGEDDARRYEIYNHLGRAQQWQGNISASMETYHNLKQLAARYNQPRYLAHAWNELSLLYEMQGHNSRSRECARQAEEIARRNHLAEELARALFNQGWACYREGQPEKAWQLGQAALDALPAEQTVASDIRLRCLNLFAAVHLLRDEYEQAEQFWQQSLDRLVRENDLINQATMIGNLGSLATARGEYEKALDFFRQSARISRQIGDTHGEIIARINESDALSALQRYEEGEQAARESIAAHKTQQSSVYTLSVAYRNLSTALEGQNRLEEALSTAKQALALIQQTGDQQEIAATYQQIGGVIAALGTETEIEGRACSARDCFRRADAIFADLGSRSLQARNKRFWARMELQYGDPELGAALWQEARQMLQELGLEQEAAEMQNQPPPGPPTA